MISYTNTIIIELPREEVIKLFNSKENLYKWMKGLKNVEPIDDVEGEVGSRMRLQFITGKREMEMIETITKKNLPEEFHGTYETSGVVNTQRNFFRQEGAHKTKWISESDFHFTNWMRYFAPLMKGLFKKQSFKFMQDFKRFAEDGINVNKEGKK
jgi:uncharacterized membrane protein